MEILIGIFTSGLGFGIVGTLAMIFLFGNKDRDAG